MKKILIAGLGLCLFVACKNENTKSTDEKTEASAVSTPALAYTTKEVPTWERGNDDNVAIAMNTLKSYETGNVDNMRQYLADSVEFKVDMWEFNGPADSLISQVKAHRATFSACEIRMDDYESVINKDKTREYVSLWYLEKTTDLKGKVDSAITMDDIRIKNGKVVSIDSKVRHFAPAKPM